MAMKAKIDLIMVRFERATVIPNAKFCPPKNVDGESKSGLDGAMKTKTLLVTLVLCFASGTACFANPFMGTWKLNEAKSKFAAGTAKNTTVEYKSLMFQTKVTVDGTDGKGKPAHNQWIGKFDGKDYAVTGDSMSDMRAYTVVGDHAMNMTIKKSGKVVGTGKIVVAADDKSRTVTTWGRNRKGKKVTNVAVYDKQ
jgi:hypothetical protein